jgi:hypothetical protein
MIERVSRLRDAIEQVISERRASTAAATARASAAACTISGRSPSIRRPSLARTDRNEVGAIRGSLQILSCNFHRI